MSAEKITIETTVNKPIAEVWNCWNAPEHIQGWAFAMDTWHVPAASNDLRVGGQFVTTMAAKDGSVSFDFTGTYTEVVENEKIAYAIADGRVVEVTFEPSENGVRVTETFEPESVNPPDMQRAGWQAILDNYKKYTEAQ